MLEPVGREEMRDQERHEKLDHAPEERLAFWVLFLIAWAVWFMGMMSVITVLLVIDLLSE